MLCCIWLPLYYGYDIIYHFAVGDAVYGWNAIKNIGLILAFAFVVPFILQALLAVILERKRIRASFSQMVPTILCFPLFMIIYAISITLGVFSKPKWSAVARSASAGPEHLLAASEAAASADSSADVSETKQACESACADVSETKQACDGEAVGSEKQ